MRIGLTGGSGLLGSLLAPRLAMEGHQVIPLVRHQPGPGEIQWLSGSEVVLRDTDLARMDAIVHLAGENIGHRWTPARRRRIRESRTLGTAGLARRLAAAGPSRGPSVLVAASAIGYYGSRGDLVLTEASSSGAGFLADVCREWESATQPAEDAGLRVVRLRMGLPLTADGGVLGRMLLPFRLGVGGRMGSGRQWMSWIAVDDLAMVYARVLSQDGFRGPINAVAPHPVRNSEFTRVLGRVLHRPAFLPIPALALETLFGQMARETILSSARVLPERLLVEGFEFRYPELEAALRHELRGEA